MLILEHTALPSEGLVFMRLVGGVVPADDATRSFIVSLH